MYRGKCNRAYSDASHDRGKCDASHDRGKCNVPFQLSVGEAH
jgi:hypothetical protein